MEENVYFLNFLPKQSFLSFPDSMVNSVNNEIVRFRSHYIKAKVSFNKTQLEKVKKYKIAENILIIISLFFIIYIPILFFKFIFSLMGEVIFNKRNIKILRRLGLSLILFYVAFYAFYWLQRYCMNGKRKTGLKITFVKNIFNCLSCIS